MEGVYVEPKVSVIVPVYNVSNYLDDAINSIINQSYSNLEIILVNDGSTDDSPEICRKYADVDSRIVFVDFKENKGQSSARNYGMDISTGKYIAFMDSDDSFVEGAIEKLVEFAKSKDVDVIGYNANHIKNNDTSAFIKEKYDDSIIPGEEYLMRMLKYNQIKDVVWLYFYKAEFLKNHKIRFVEDRIFEDELWVTTIFLQAHSSCFMDENCYNYYYRKNSVMTRSDINRKKFIHKKKNCHELDQITNDFMSDTNKPLFRDYIARMYMSGSYFAYYSDLGMEAVEFSYIKSLISQKTTYLKYILLKYLPAMYFKIKKMQSR